MPRRGCLWQPLVQFAFYIWYPLIYGVNLSFATILMWRFMMAPDPGGIIISIMANFGVPNFGWLQIDWATKPLIVTTLTWKAAGACDLTIFTQTIAPLSGVKG